MLRTLIIGVLTSITICQGQTRLDLLLKAEDALVQADTASALASLEEVLKGFPRSFAAAKRLAEVYYHLNNDHKSILYANIAIEITEDYYHEATDPKRKDQFRRDMADAHHLKGLTRIKQHRYSDAIKELDRAMAIDSSNYSIPLDKGMVYMSAGRTDSARYYFHKLKSIPTLRSKVLFSIGNSFYKEKILDSALYYYNSVIKEYPLFKTACHYKGMILTENQRYAEAVDAYSKFIRLDSMSEVIYFKRAVLYNELGQLTDALQDWTRVLALNASNQEAYRNRGLTYFKKGDYERAISDFDEALKLAPDQALTRINRGYAYYLANQPKKALADLNVGIEQTPKYYWGPYFRALVHLQLRNKKAACKDAKRAVELGMKESDIQEILIKKCF